jgi:hypothetical protein
MEPEPNQIYHVNHSRKGKFTMRVDSVKGEWVSGQVISGTAKAMMDYNIKEAGDEITIRLCHSSFTQPTP